MHRRVLKFLYHFAVYAVGISVLLAAISVTIIRLLLPDIGMYRGEIEAWVSQYMGFPVAIRSLEADWEGWVPHLYLQDIDLLNRDGTRTITHFEKARVSIAPVATLVERRFVPRHLQISGFRLSAMRREDGSIYIQGIRLEDRAAPEQKRNELAEWLFQQNKIEINNAEIDWIDQQHEQASVLLRDVHLLLRTYQDRIQIEGSARLPSDYGDILDFALDARGDLMTSNWSGELYLEGKNINPDNWYRQYRPFEINVTGGTADIKVWSGWENARIRDLQGKLEYGEFSAFIGEKDLQVENMAYEFLGERYGENDWRFSINLHDFVTENGMWPESRLTLTAEPLDGRDKYNYSARFSYLKVDDLAPLLGNLSFIPERIRDALAELRLHGNLIDGTVRYQPGKDPERQFSYDVRFDQLTTHSEGDLPRIENLSGHASGTLTGGRINFSGDSGDLIMPDVRGEPIPIAAIDGTLNWSRSSDGLSLHSRLLSLSNKDITARMAGSASLHKDAPIYLDLIAELGHADLDTLKGYIPYTPDFKMRTWMEKSVLGGDLISATALIRGRLPDFPFRQRNGQFKVIANVENGVLEYSDKWPIVDNITSEIVIDSNRLSALVNRGQVYDAVFNDARLEIPELFRKQKHILTSGRITGEMTNLKTFLKQSPLINDVSIAEAEKALSGGRFALDLDLDIPWKIPGARPGIEGQIELNNARLASKVSRIELNDLSGSVAFTPGSISGENLKASFNGEAVTLGIEGSKVDQVSNTAITLSGQADKTLIAGQIQRYLPGLAVDRQLILDRISGKTSWTATLQYHKPEKADTLKRSLTLESDLTGLNISLPAPLDKKAGMAKRLRVFRRLNESVPPLIKLDYGDDLSVNFTLSGADRKSLQSVDILFGDGRIKPVPDGINIAGNIDTLSINEWWDFLKKAGGGEGSFETRPLTLDLDINNLYLLSQHFSSVGLTIKKETDEWLLDLDGDEIAGRVSLPAPLTRDSLATINLDRLHLQQIDKTHHSRLDPRALPSLRAAIGDFKYDDMSLGSVELSATSSSDGMAFNTITFTKPGLSIHGQGKWASRDNGDKSSFAIEVQADEIDNMLRTFGYNVTTIKDGETTLLINADWEGSPMQFSLEKLNGSISMRINEGQLLNVEPSAGRLFGLLSIQALPRRLTLDFRDLFGEGLAFDRIEGNFVVTNGNAYTNDLFMYGPSANVSVSGRTGLSEKDYDQRVTVTPQVAESLPVAGAIFGPVGIGIGAIFYIAGEMFESLRTNIDSLLRYQYTITGSWEEPVVEKVTPEREASG